jgi:hypothetical protein
MPASPDQNELAYLLAEIGFYGKNINAARERAVAVTEEIPFDFSIYRVVVFNR